MKRLIEQQKRYLLGQMSEQDFLLILKERISEKRKELDSKRYERFIQMKQPNDIVEETRKFDAYSSMKSAFPFNENKVRETRILGF